MFLKTWAHGQTLQQQNLQSYLSCAASFDTLNWDWCWDMVSSLDQTLILFVFDDKYTKTLSVVQTAAKAEQRGGAPCAHNSADCRSFAWTKRHCYDPQKPKWKSLCQNISHISSTCWAVLLFQTDTECDSPRADPHEGDRSAGEENGHEKERLPAPDIWQRTNQRSWQERQEALNRNTHTHTHTHTSDQKPPDEVHMLQTKESWLISFRLAQIYWLKETSLQIHYRTD